MNKVNIRILTKSNAITILEGNPNLLDNLSKFFDKYNHHNVYQNKLK